MKVVVHTNDYTGNRIGSRKNGIMTFARVGAGTNAKEATMYGEAADGAVEEEGEPHAGTAKREQGVERERQRPAPSKLEDDGERRSAPGNAAMIGTGGQSGNTTRRPSRATDNNTQQEQTTTTNQELIQEIIQKTSETQDRNSKSARRYRQRRAYKNYFPAEVERNKTPNIVEARKERQTRLDEESRPSTDNYDYGDSLFVRPNSEETRIFFQNVNGISGRDEWQDAREIGYMARQQWISILALAETKIDWKKGKAKRQCLQALKSFWTAAKIGTASSMLDFESIYQPGGVLQLIGNEWSSRVVRTEEDPKRMGRWIGMTLQGKQGQAITMISAYQVVDDSNALHRPRTAYKQQWTMLRTDGDRNPDPRKAFVTDIIKYITREQEQDNDIILMLDANDNLTDPKSNLGRELLARGMTNVYQHLHAPYDEMAEEPATFNRGSRCIDFIYATPGVLPFITKCGITAFQEGVAFSDHRGLFIDMELQSFLGKPQLLLPQQVRGMRSNNPKSCKKYTPAVMKYLEDHNVEERAQAMTTPRKIEGVDNDVTRALLHSEKKHGNKFATPWSAKLIQAKMTVRYWKLWLSEIRTTHDLHQQRMSLVAVLAEKPWASTLYRGDVSFVAARKELKLAQKRASEITKNGAKHREEMLQERIEAAYLCENNSKANIEKRIRATEAARAKYRRIQTTLKRKTKGGIQFILVPDENVEGKWNGIFDQDEIAQRLMERNRKHFGQAQGTPFTIGPLQGLFEWSGNTEGGDRVIEGVFNATTHDIDEATKCILNHLTTTPSLPTINDAMSEHDIRQGFRKWKEGTSTSRDRHLGLYKALMAYEIQTYDSDRNEIPKVSTRVYQVIADVINAAKSQGHVLQRWKHVTNVMLEKIPGKPRIDKLRVIHLFEADLNLYLGILWSRRLMWNAEDHQCLNDEQWGSRSGRMCSDVVLLKHFTYLMSHMTKTTLGTFDNDAKSCYDRIVVNLAMLISRTMGMTRDAAGLHAEFLRQAEYHLKTQMGITDEFYSNDADVIHGTGQGSRASPALWVIISSVIIALIRKKSDGVYAASSDLGVWVRRWMDGFVDDKTAWINRFLEEMFDEFAEQDITETITTDLSAAAQWWEQLLFSTGGQLELGKCLYYIMSWEFDEEGKPSLRPLASIPGTPITVESSAGTGHETIRHFDCTTSHKTLGVMENPSLNYEEEWSRLCDKVTALTSHLVVDPMYPGDASTMYSSILMPSVGYSLVAMSFDRDKMDNLNSRPLSLVLRQMGYNRSTPRAVVHGPAYYGGLGMQSFYVKMGTDKTLALIRNLRHYGKVGKYMHICMDWFQLTTGYGIDCFQVTVMAIPHAVGDWFPHLRDFLASSELYIKTTKPLYVVTRRRHGDRILMEDALAHNSVSEIKAINRTRLYLRVETLADCTDTAGKYLLRAVLDKKEADKHELGSFPTRFWPRQGRPGIKTWAIWRQFIRR
jgi:hypothetical protein